MTWLVRTWRPAGGYPHHRSSPPRPLTITTATEPSECRTNLIKQPPQEPAPSVWSTAWTPPSPGMPLCAHGPTYPTRLLPVRRRGLLSAVKIGKRSLTALVPTTSTPIPFSSSFSPPFFVLFPRKVRYLGAYQGAQTNLPGDDPRDRDR